MLHLGQHRRQDAIGQLVDESVLFRHCHEPVRRNRPESRTVPAGERLDPDDTTGGDLGLGLIDRKHFAVSQRLLEILRHRLLAGPFLRQRVRRPPARHQIRQSLQPNRLLQRAEHREVARSRQAFRYPKQLGILAAHQYHGPGEALVRQLTKELDTVHAGHVEVAENQIDGMIRARQQRQSSSCGVHGGHLRMTGRFQDMDGSLEAERVIIDDKHSTDRYGSSHRGRPLPIYR